MNRAQRYAVVLLLASAVASYEQAAHEDAAEVRQQAGLNAAMEADGPRLRTLLIGLFERALGREHRRDSEPAE
ncbi:MAG TPA: hypothetical protein VGT01_11785 [Candidatus Dormibacteraeota bacterium]|nr:hypothetical protein [Candidatus Dormibacteraeota bacterium]